jgi:hypothetical protein
LAVFLLGRRLALGCVAAVMALGSAGCSGGGSKPVSLPSISSSASPSPSATTTQTQLDAVSAVVRSYYSLLNSSTTVANGESLAALMTAGCTCRRVATSVIDVAKKGQTYFGRNQLVSVTPSSDGPVVAEAFVEYDYTAGGIKDEHGHVLSTMPGRVGAKLNFILNLRDGHWLIAEVRLIKEGRPA